MGTIFNLEGIIQRARPENSGLRVYGNTGNRGEEGTPGYSLERAIELTFGPKGSRSRDRFDISVLIKSQFAKYDYMGMTPLEYLRAKIENGRRRRNK